MSPTQLVLCTLLAAAAASPCSDIAAQAPRASSAAPASIRATYELPALRLGELQNARLPASVANDRKLALGGVGSDLWRGATDAADEFWMVTDRGPNGQVEVEGKQRRTLLVPEYTPHVLHVRAKDGALSIVASIPLVGASGKAVSGMPNVAKRDEKPFDATGRTELAYDASGLDTEGLVRTSSGELWLADEYGPSLVRVSPAGVVLQRFVPLGAPTTGADYEVVPALPAIYGKRKSNRGFEGLALSRDEKTLYALLQSPLSVPDKKTGEASRHSRVLAFDIAARRPVAEYLYRIEVAGDVDPKAVGEQDEMKLSGIVALDARRLLVLERTDDLAKLFLVDLEGASDLLGTRWDDGEATASLEALTDPGDGKLVPLRKTLAVDLAALKELPRKLEGIAVIDATTIAVANDDDFDVGELDERGNNVGTGAKSRLIVLSLAQPLY
jgi:hypothetical protein